MNAACKLSQFRRHPDWRAAEKRVYERWCAQAQVWGIPDKDMPVFTELVDQEFIDEIIYREKVAEKEKAK